MTVYNAERYVGNAVESILGQTHRDFEFIILDDGSRDGSRAILETYAKRDARIHLVSRPNTGISKARNETLDLARGRYYAIIDADDIAMPHRIERQLAYMTAHETCVCVGAWFEVIDEAGRLLTMLRTPETDAEIQELLLEGHAAICQPVSMLRKDAIERVGRFDETLAPAEDLDLYLKLGEIGQLANLPEPLLRYRMHAKSASSLDRVRQHNGARIACERAWKRRGIEGRFAPASPWRPDGTRRASYDWSLKCGWWAFGSRERRTALLYGMKAIAAQPHRSGGWRLAACSVLKSGGFNGHSE
jgi:glycosyltransferase involved in cell wall biosynthesis